MKDNSAGNFVKSKSTSGKIMFFLMCILASSISYAVISGLWWFILSIVLILLPKIVLLVFLKSSSISKFTKVFRVVTNLLTVILLSFFFKLFVLGIYTVDSISMKNTLFPGDVVLVNKLWYGPILPNFISNTSFFKKIYSLYQDNNTLNGIIPFRLKGISEIKTNDISIFFSADRKDLYVKRCLAGPGDRVEIINGCTFVNNVLVSQFPKDLLFLSDTIRNYNELLKEAQCFLVPFIGYELIDCERRNGEVNKIQNEPIMGYYKNNNLNYFHLRNFQKNYYFFQGDNILRSIDSRTFGPVPEDLILGKVSLLLFSKRDKKRIFLKRL